MKRGLFVLLCLAFTACSARYADFFPYHDDGSKKPFVTLLAVCDDAEQPKPDSFCPQLSKQVRNRLKRHGRVYCPPEELARKSLQERSLSELAHTSDLELFTRFKGSDYVCLIDLIRYETIAYKRNTISPLYLANLPEQDAKVLMIAARLNIVDISGSSPKFVRQEVVESNHMIPRDPSEVNLDMIRSRFARDLEEKIEQTVCVKK